jgi:hypothetical protein
LQNKGTLREEQQNTGIAPGVKEPTSLYSPFSAPETWAKK